MKTVLAWTGAFVLVLCLLGAVGVGSFVMIYSPHKITCTEETV